LGPKKGFRLARLSAIAYEAKVISAHRTPDRLVAFSKAAKEDGVKVIIAGAGGAGAKNAALLAASILSLSDDKIAKALSDWRSAQTASVALDPRPAS